MSRTLADDDTPYDLEARQIRKGNVRAQRRLETYICQLEKSYRGCVSLLDKQISQTKLEARTFKFEKDRTTFDLFQKYNNIAKDLNGNEIQSAVPILQVVRSKTFDKLTWQNPESEEYKAKLMEDNDKVLASGISRRVQSEPVRPTLRYGRLDIPFRRENVRPNTCTTKSPHRVTHKVLRFKANDEIKRNRPLFISEGSRLSLKQRGERSKVLPVFTNPATAHIHALWESNKCLSRGHVPIGGIHFEVPTVKGKALNNNNLLEKSYLTTQPPSEDHVLTFRLPKMSVPQKQTPRRRVSRTVYSVKLVS